LIASRATSVDRKSDTDSGSRRRSKGTWKAEAITYEIVKDKGRLLLASCSFPFATRDRRKDP
jgi:hypothetical protein